MKADMPTSVDDDPPTLHLHNSHLTAMGMDKLPKIGQKVPLRMHGTVRSASDDGKGNRHISLELEKMAERATKRASESDIREGQLTGAKAAMDQALDAQEMSPKQNAKHGKAVGRKP